VQGQADVKFFLHNHLRFTILYNRDALTDLSRIVGFEVEPFSAKHEYELPYDKNNPDLKTCNPGRMVHVTHSLPPQSVEEGAEVIFTYDVIFQVGGLPPAGCRRAPRAPVPLPPGGALRQLPGAPGRACPPASPQLPAYGASHHAQPAEAAPVPCVRLPPIPPHPPPRQESEIRWASRWDTYLKMVDDQIHWFSIVNSVMIVLFLSGMVAMIMMRTLHRDITKYNQLETSDDAQEETGWKLVGRAALQAGWGGRGVPGWQRPGIWCSGRAPRRVAVWGGLARPSGSAREACRSPEQPRLRPGRLASAPQGGQHLAAAGPRAHGCSRRRRA
jgi:hypothetical protein